MNNNMEIQKTNQKKRLKNSEKHINSQCRICRTNYGSITFKEELICESCIDYIKNSL